jgi:hypothetical protein
VYVIVHKIISKEMESATEVSHNSSSGFLSGEARAQLVVKADNISFDCKLHVFNVKGLSGTTRVVSLFPKPTCSCPWIFWRLLPHIGSPVFHWHGHFREAGNEEKPNTTKKEHKEQEGEEEWKEKTPFK